MVARVTSPRRIVWRGNAGPRTAYQDLAAQQHRGGHQYEGDESPQGLNRNQGVRDLSHADAHQRDRRQAQASEQQCGETGSPKGGWARPSWDCGFGHPAYVMPGMPAWEA